MSKHKKMMVWLVLIAFVFVFSGCGYIMHPERRTAPLSNQKDTETIVLDCLWLIPGVVPGVVALGVDAMNDTWYYTEAEAAELGK
ncbi:MAG: hypothetical protein JEZ07_13845 [Phycisphaerae bacterium]|nr:hypothetical protein [Phycisphaerae bacterium]